MEMIESARLVSMPHALLADGREVCFAEFLPRETLGAYVLRNAIAIPTGPVYVHHNGYLVPEHLWARLIPRPGDLVTIRARMQGGGGGNKVLRTVALVAIAVASAGAGAWAASAYGAYAGAAAGTVTTGMAVAGAAAASAVMIGGSLLVNALIPLPKPVTAKLAQQESDAPSFTIGAASNRARPFEPMMFVFGRHKVYPDLAGNPHTFYYGDDQFLNQAFHFGLQQDLEISDLRIGDTDILSYQGVTIQRSDYTGQLSIVPDNVDTLAGFDLLYVDGWTARTTPKDVYHVQLELVAALYNINAQTGAFEPRSVEVAIEYRSYPEGNWTPVGGYTDPIYATHYWALGKYKEQESGDSGALRYWEQIRFGSLNAGDHVNGEQYQECRMVETGSGDNYGQVQVCVTYEWRWLPHPFQLGRPWSGVAPDPLIGYTTNTGVKLTGSSNKPVRITISFNTGHGQYEVRLRKMQPDVSTNTESNAVSVAQIRAYQDTPTDYTGQARLGIRLRASAQLNGSINQLSAMVQAHCWVWTGAAWEWRATSNPAWWFLYFSVGMSDAAGNRLWGAGLAAEQIDYQGIFAWAAWCESKGLTFDYVLTQQKTAHEMLTMIARAGRASYTWQSGKLGVIWDAANQPHVGIVGPFNIKAGSFEVSYADATVDEIIGTFINPARNWEADEIRVAVPGAPRLNSPQKFELEGTISPELAARETNLIAASQLFHRRRVVWEMDIEGMMCTRGDVVQASHDLTVWGYSGRLKGGTRQLLILDRFVPITGAPAWMTLRTPHGAMANIQVGWTAGETDRVNVLSAWPAGFLAPDEITDTYTSALDFAWQFDPLTTPGRRLKIVHVQPLNDEGVRFEAVDDDPNYYNAEWNPYAYTPPRDGALIGSTVFAITFAETIQGVGNDDIEVRLDYVLSSAGRVRIDFNINSRFYSSVETTERNFVLKAHTGDLIQAQVTPLTLTGQGTPKYAEYSVVGLLIPLPAVDGLTSVYRDGLTVLRWNQVVDLRAPRYELRMGASWDDSQTIAITNSVESLAVGNGRYFVSARFDAPKGQVLYGPADSLEVAGATLVRNVLVTKAEHPGWTGDLGGAETVPVVATDPARFGGGDGNRTAFSLPVTTVDGEPVIYREDWQGRQLLYRTARTNFAQYTEDFTPTFWSKSGVTVQSAQALAPDGTLTANKITENSTNSTHIVSRGFPRAGGTTWTWSIFAKAAERSVAQIQIGNFANQVASNTVVIDLLTGNFTATDPSRTVITQFPDGWWRISTTVTIIQTASDLTIAPSIYTKAAFGGSATYLGDGSSGIYAWGAQFESGSLPTPYLSAPVNVARTITDYTRSGATITTAIAPLSGASMLWTGSGSRMQGGAAIIDNKLTLRGIGDMLAVDDVFAVDEVLWYGGVSGRGIYGTNDANIIDIGYPAPVRVDFDIDAYALNFGENVLSVEDIFAEDDILNASSMQFYSIQPQIRSAVNAGEWSDWVDYVPGLINARFFDVRLVLETRNPLIVPFVESFTWTVDVPDLIQRGELVTVPVGGLHIVYDKWFHATPNVQITWLNAVNGDRYVLSNQSEQGFSIVFYNGNTSVSRQMNHISQGY